MTAYLHSSALIKLVIDEAGRDTVIEHLASSDGLVATVPAARVEVAAALARARHAGRLSADEAWQAWSELLTTWSDLVVLRVDDSILEQAGVLALRHALGAGQAVHLAAAVSVPILRPFLSFDAALNRAARAEELWVPGA
jgi:predicted nucleic acid-binding protein